MSLNDYQTLLTPAHAATAADGLADLAFQWTDDVSAAQDVLQQPGVGPADGQYASYLTTMAHQARETEVRLAREAYVAAIAGGQTTRADDLGTAEDAFATALNAAGSAYASAVNTAESGFTGGAGSAGMSHVQGLVNADVLYSNSLAGSSRNLTGQLGNADVFLTHALGSADAGYRTATAQREAAYQVGLAQRQEAVLASWSHPDSLFEHARASAERVFLQGTQTAYATFASNQAQADADRDTARAQAGANHQVRQADADILYTAQLGVNDVGHTVGVAASHQDVFDDLTTLVNSRRSQLFTPYQSAATAEAADGHAYAVGLADAEGAYQTAVAAARRAYQQAAAPIENQFAFAVYQAEYNYQAALTAQEPNAWTQYQAALQTAGDTRNAAIQPLMAAQQAAVTQAERDRTADLADAERDRIERLADREQTFTQGYGVANRNYLSGLAVALQDLDYDLAPLDESHQNAVAGWDAQLERDYAQSETLLWSAEQDAENVWSAAAGQAQADLWQAEYLSQTAAAAELDNQLNSAWSDVQLDLASAKQSWWNVNEPAYLDWIDLTSAADTAYQSHVSAAYRGRTGGWTGADVDYTRDVAAAARQWVEERADEEYDYLMDQAGRSYTYVDQYAQSRHDARVAWAAADRWSRIGQDDSGAVYDSERHGQDVQAAHDAFAAATDASRREYRIPRATGEAHRQIRLAEVDLQYVDDVAGAYVDWTADVELHRRGFTKSEATEASGRTYSIAAADDSYWRQEAGTFAADLAASYPPSSSGPIGAPWGTHAGAQELEEAGWVTTTSTGRNAWEGTVADSRETERFDVAAALETRNNRLAAAWADREITTAEGRLQTARTSAYGDVLATLACENGTGSNQDDSCLSQFSRPRLPRLPGCSTATTGDPTTGSSEDAACLPGLSPVNLDAVLADDYVVPDQIMPPWDGLGGTGVLSWAPPVQLADNQVHPVTPPLPATWLFSGSPPSPIDLSASLAFSGFSQYYNNVVDQIFGRSDFDHNGHLRGFRALGTGVDAVFQAYGSPAGEAVEHLLDGAGGNDGTNSASLGDLSPDGGYADSTSSGASISGGMYGATGESGGVPGLSWFWPTSTGGTTLVPDSGGAFAGNYGYGGYNDEGTSGGSYSYSGVGTSDPIGPPNSDVGGTTGGLSGGDSNPAGTTIVLPSNHPLARPQTEQFDAAIQEAVRETEHKQWREILGGGEGPLTLEQEEELARRITAVLVEEMRQYVARLNAELRIWKMLEIMEIPEGDRNMTPGEFILRVYLPYQVRCAQMLGAQTRERNELLVGPGEPWDPETFFGHFRDLGLHWKHYLFGCGGVGSALLGFRKTDLSWRGSAEVMAFDEFADAVEYLKSRGPGLIIGVQAILPWADPKGLPLPKGFGPIPASSLSDGQGYNYAVLLVGTDGAPYWVDATDCFTYGGKVAHKWKNLEDDYVEGYIVNAVYFVVPEGVLKTDFPPFRSLRPDGTLCPDGTLLP